MTSYGTRIDMRRPAIESVTLIAKRSHAWYASMGANVMVSREPRRARAAPRRRRARLVDPQLERLERAPVAVPLLATMAVAPPQREDAHLRGARRRSVELERDVADVRGRSAVRVGRAVVSAAHRPLAGRGLGRLRE